MRAFDRIRHFFRNVFAGGSADRDLDEEIRHHIELEVEDGVRSGLSEAEARRRALLAFGGVERHREAARDQRGTFLLEEIRRDIGLALRGMRRNPGFATVAILTLALGIGANTAIFSMVDGVVLRPPPFEDPDRLVVVWETDRDSGTRFEPASVPDFLDFRERAATMRDLEAVLPGEANLDLEGRDPARITLIRATAGALGLLGVRPILGRGFSDDPAVSNEVVVSESLWRAALGGTPDAIGATVRLDETSAVVVGVLAEDADYGLAQMLGAADYGRSFADRGASRVDAWVRLDPDPTVFPRATHPIFMLGRLRDGVGVAAAQAELAGIAAELEVDYPENNARGVHVQSLEEVVVGPVRTPLLLLLAAVGMVLLIACVNVASLLLARGTARTREVAIRTALGGGRARLMGQFLVEGAVYAAVAALAGLGVAALGVALLRGAAPADLPAVHRVGIDLRVLGVTLGVSAMVALIFGLVPAFQADTGDLGARLQGAAPRGATASRGRRRLRAGLVVAELALAVAIATGAGLLVRSFRAVTSVDPGFDTTGVVKAELQLPTSRYPRDFSVWPNWPPFHGFQDALLAELASAPGVASAATAGPHPLAPGFTNSFVIEGRDPTAPPLPEIPVRPVSAAYFETVGLPIVQGTTMASARPDGPGVAVVNRAAEEAYFDGAALGRRLQFWGVSREIVGVVGNEAFRGVDQAPPPAVYVPTAQAPQWNISVLVSGDDPAALAGILRSSIQTIDPGLAVFGVEPLERTLAGTLSRRRFPMLLMTLLASLALTLALIGVHGVLSYTVEQRRREMGIRLALGARPGDLLRLVLGEGLRLAALGIGLGLLAAWALTRVLSALLFGVQPGDPLTFGAVASLVVVAALAAAAVPAFRASRVDPARTLQTS